MKSYMVVYSTGSSAGRFFVDTENNKLPSADQIEEWERLAFTEFGHKGAAVIGFYEVAYPAADREQTA